MTSLPESLVLVGAGKMGGAMLEGWLAIGLPPKAIRIIDPQPADSLRVLCASRGIALNPSDAIDAPDVLVLAVKPQTFTGAAAAIAASVGTATLVLSIMAGKTIGDIAARLPNAKAIVRAMPNTPASVGRGITGCFANTGVSEPQRAMAAELLAAIGRVEWVENESLIDAVTAVSGSGPAYVFFLVEALAGAGVHAGLPADVAMRLARATVEGSGELLYRDAAVAAEQLRKNVTSPGGTTAAALDVLMAPDGLEPLITRAVEAAKRRAAELSG